MSWHFLQWEALFFSIHILQAILSSQFLFEKAWLILLSPRKSRAWVFSLWTLMLSQRKERWMKRRLTHFTLTAVLAAFTQRSDWDEDFKRSGRSAVRLIRCRFTADMFMEQSAMEKRHGSHHILHHYAEISTLEKRLKSVFVLHHCGQMLYT